MAKKSSTPLGTRILAIVLCVLLAGGAVFAGIYYLIDLAYADELPATDVAITLDESLETLRVSMRLSYRNDTNAYLREAPFALHANLFRRAQTCDFCAFPEGYNPGGAVINSCRVDGVEADYGFRGEGEQFLTVRVALAPGATCDIALNIDYLIPRAEGFFSLSDRGYVCSYFLPTPVIRTDGAPVYVPLRAFGGAQAFPLTNYRVTLDVPENCRVACGGDVTETVLNGRRTVVVALDGARDFAFTASRNDSRYDDGPNAAFTNTRQGAARALDALRKARSFYEAAFGACPYPSVRIAQVAMNGRSEAHAGLLLVDESLFALNRRDELAQTIYELTAGLWFGQAVATNGETTPYLSDGLCRFLALLTRGEADGAAQFERALAALSEAAFSITLPGALTPAADRAVFLSDMEYETVVAQRGALAFAQLYELLGKERFMAALSRYRADNRGGLATESDFLGAVSEASGKSLDAFWADVLSRTSRAG